MRIEHISGRVPSAGLLEARVSSFLQILRTSHTHTHETMSPLLALTFPDCF